jgi:hypothetical protein
MIEKIHVLLKCEHSRVRLTSQKERPRIIGDESISAISPVQDVRVLELPQSG